MIVLDTNIVSETMKPEPDAAVLAAVARSDGCGLPMPDGYIAAIAASKGFAIATRDTGPFEASGLQVVDPWTA